MSQLLIRPMFNDHVVIADLLTRSPTAVRSLRPPLAQLVVDAHVAARRPQFAEAAADSGIPVLVDPLTPLLQSFVHPDDNWLSLPYAASHPVMPSEMDQQRLIEQSVTHQLEVGGTRIIAPYLYAESPDDPAFKVSQELVTGTRRYLDEQRLGLPLVAVFCGQLQGFGRESSLRHGVERFARLSGHEGTDTLALCLSPLGNRADSYAKLAAMARVALASKRSGIDVIAWRQGVYGPALCAMGLDGYETGIGISEQSNIKSLQANRRTRDERDSKPVVHGMYFEPLGRSLPLRVANRLLGSIQMRARIVCDDPSCCTDVNDMIDRRRHHAVRSRSRFLAELNQQPHASWRLNHVSRHARTGATVARQADAVLEAEGVRERVGTKNLEALGRLAAELAESSSGQQSA